MGESKINIKIGHVEFSGEGEQEWLGIQLDKILGKVPELLKIELRADGEKDEPTSDGAGSSRSSASTANVTLAAWLASKSATTNQNKKFLATAAFLQLNGKDRLTTADINKVLKKAVQAKLNNTADKLNQNTKQGFCEKDGGSFFVTADGLKDLGIKQE